MTSTINTNVQSLTAQRNLGASQASLAISMQRLSSGLRVNNARDDAAGLSIGDRMSAQVRGLNQAARNANDGISLAQVAEGALGSASGVLQRIRELAVQSVNATNSASDRAALNIEVVGLRAELDRIAKTTQFNGKNILDGSFTSAALQVGTNANQTIDVNIANFDINQYGNHHISPLQDMTSVLGWDNNSAPIIEATPGTQFPPNAPNIADTSLGYSNYILEDTLVVRGSNGTANVAVATGDSAENVAASINAQTNLTGVTARAYTRFYLGDFGNDTGDWSIKITPVNKKSSPVIINFSIASNQGFDTSDSTTDLENIAAAFNEKSNETGLVAQIDVGTNLQYQPGSVNKHITLTNMDGTDYSIECVNSPGLAWAGSFAIQTPNSITDAKLSEGSALYVVGSISLNSDSPFQVTAPNAGGGGKSFFLTTNAASALQSVAALDVSTVESATRSLSIVDGAIDKISSQRAQLGAIQSRIETTINNLQTTSDNISASRSRIMDADFAMETSNLSRTQILQQAGTAMVAQANQLPSAIMSLLR